MEPIRIIEYPSLEELISAKITRKQLRFVKIFGMHRCEFMATVLDVRELENGEYSINVRMVKLSTQEGQHLIYSPYNKKCFWVD